MINAMTLIWIVNIPFWSRPSYGVYISHLIRFARVCSHDVDDFKCFHDDALTATRVGLEPPTSGSGVRGVNHQDTAPLGYLLVKQI